MAIRLTIALLLMTFNSLTPQAFASPPQGQNTGFLDEDLEALLLTASRTGGGTLSDEEAQMLEIWQEMVQRMHDRGIDPQQFLTQEVFVKMQNDRFDSVQFQQMLLDKGIVNETMLTRLQGTTQRAALDFIRRRLGSTDEEWSLLLPRLKQVVAHLSNLGQLKQGRMMLGQAPAPAIIKAQFDLQLVLSDQSTTPGIIFARLKAYRELVSKARTALISERESLRSLLTIRQEAILVTLDVLD